MNTPVFQPPVGYVWLISDQDICASLTILTLVSMSATDLKIVLTLTFSLCLRLVGLEKQGTRLGSARCLRDGRHSWSMAALCPSLCKR